MTQIDGAAHTGHTGTPRRDEEERRAREHWLGVAEPGDGTAHTLIDALGAARARDLVASDVSAAVIVSELLEHTDAGADAVHEVVELVAHGLNRWRPRIGTIDSDAYRRAAERCGARFIMPGDRDWPSGVDDLGENAPLGLWVRGSLDVLPTRSVAVVGSRNSTGYGEHVTMEIASGLVARGVGIISGAAYGIDGHAHRATLASGGATAAFLAGGIDRPYPRGHSDLIERIATEGVLLSEVPCGSTPTRWRFLQRNRLISALGTATIIVEAGWRSGSLNTAAHASTLGRPLGAVPGPVTSPASAGCHRLLRENDAVCVTSADEAAELAGDSDDTDILSPLRDWIETRVLDALSSRRPRTVDEIASRSGLDHDAVRSRLGTLNVLGDVRETPNGWLMA